MNRLHAFVAALAVVCMGPVARAAVPVNYQLQPAASETYVPLAGGTPVSFPSSSTTGTFMAQVSLPANFGFRWFGQPVTSIWVDQNGFISFSNQAQGICSYTVNFYDCYYGSSLPIAYPQYYPVDSLYARWGPLVPICCFV